MEGEEKHRNGVYYFERSGLGDDMTDEWIWQGSLMFGFEAQEHLRGLLRLIIVDGGSLLGGVEGIEVR